MDKKKIEKYYNLKIKELIRLNKYYYEFSKPLTKDSDYDEIKNEILQIEKKYKFLKSKNSPSNLVGYKPAKNFKKVLHKVPMLSLSNAFSKEDLINFEKRIINYLDKTEGFEIEYSAEPKRDGMSASLI